MSESHEKEMREFVMKKKDKLVKMGIKPNDAILFCAEFSMELASLLMKQKVEFDTEKA